MNTAKMTLITSRLTANLEVITIKTEVITNPARFHCFPSRFDHREMSFSAKTKSTVRLVKAFYATNGPQTTNFANFVSMTPPIFTISMEHNTQHMHRNKKVLYHKTYGIS